MRKGKNRTNRNLPWKVVYHSWRHASIYDCQDNVVCRFDLEDMGDVTEDNQDTFEAVQKELIEWVLDSCNHLGPMRDKIKKIERRPGGGS